MKEHNIRYLVFCKGISLLELKWQIEGKIMPLVIAGRFKICYTKNHQQGRNLVYLLTEFDRI